MARSDSGIGNVTPNAELVQMAMSYSRSATRLGCASLLVASAGCGEPCSSAVANVHRWDGIDSILS
jgi:hypothetical protein